MTVQATDVGIAALGPTYVVLTPYAISIFPKMLAVINPQYKLIVPTQYPESGLFDYLSNFSKPAKLRLLFEKALEANIVELKDIDCKGVSTDDCIINLARTLTEENKSVIVVASMRDIQGLRNRVNLFSVITSIEILDTQDFRKLLNASDSTIDPELLDLVKEFELGKLYIPRNKWIPFSEFVFYLIMMLLIFMERKLALNFISQLNTWVAIFMVSVFSIFLFWYRANYRFYYGTLETVFGLLVASSVLYSNLDYSQLLTIDYITLFSGIYIIIRGLDNVEKGLPYIESEIIKYLWGNGLNRQSLKSNYLFKQESLQLSKHQRHYR